jgi:hypothetical protein
MDKPLLQAILIILAILVGGWTQYQADPYNSGSASGTGYIGTSTFDNYTNYSYSYNFEPLVLDVNNDENKEIIIFDSGNLILLDNKLRLVDMIEVGSLQGQPTSYNIDGDPYIKILFISNHSINLHFFSYMYNGSDFIQELNISLNKSAINSGIKCTEIGSSDVCIFMDNSQYVNLVNLSSSDIFSYNTSSYIDTNEKIPAIGDLHNDGEKQAVFWFDENNNNEYGFLVFNIENKKLDIKFNNSGVIDDINIPHASYSDRIKLKGHPVLLDMNGDNKKEIALSMFYDDSIQLFEAFDWFMELFVFDHNGSKLFRVCEERDSSLDGNCNDGSSTTSYWEGTNPFPLDISNDGSQEICFVKDKKVFSNFKNMTINCYNYTGGEVHDAEIFPFTDTIKTATTADMNNDGILDLITPNHIYALNGSSIYKIDFSSNFIIPSDLDGNGALDLIMSKDGQITALIDNSSYSYDLFISESDIKFQKNKTIITVHNGGNGFIYNSTVLILNTQSMKNSTYTIGIPGNGNISLIANLSLKKGDEILVQLDFHEKIIETDEKNNFAIKEFKDLPIVFIDIDLEINSLEEEFIEYIQDNLKTGYITPDQDMASVKIFIGKNNLGNRQRIGLTRDNYDYYYDFGNIYHLNDIGIFPYNGLVGSYKTEGIVYVLVYGNRIEGTIAAVKEFINSESDFINSQKSHSLFVADDNLDAIRVFDYFHHTGNGANYMANNAAFKQIVKNSLRGEMFLERDYNVTTDSGINLRIRNLKPNASSEYLNFLNSSGVPMDFPVVLAHGLFSNLSSWQVLGSELSNSGRDTWLIEITGGPGQDCADCPDYSFQDLIEGYWPSLLNGVLEKSGKKTLQYVGFSNGCRTGLSSLEEGFFNSTKIDTFVGVGCPGAFEHDIQVSSTSPISDKLNIHGLSAINNFYSRNKTHISFSDLAREIVGLDRLFDTGISISLNLFNQYFEWSSSNADFQPKIESKLENFAVIQGDFFTYSDGVVSTYDQTQIYSRVNATNKNRINIWSSHLNLDDSLKTKKFIKKLINNENFTNIEKIVYFINNET